MRHATQRRRCWAWRADTTPGQRAHEDGGEGRTAEKADGALDKNADDRRESLSWPGQSLCAQRLLFNFSCKLKYGTSESVDAADKVSGTSTGEASGTRSTPPTGSSYVGMEEAGWSASRAAREELFVEPLDPAGDRRTGGEMERESASLSDSADRVTRWTDSSPRLVIVVVVVLLPAALLV